MAGIGNLYFNGLNTGLEGGLQLKKNWINLAVATQLYSYSIFNTWLINLNYNYLPNSYQNRVDLFFDFNYIIELRRVNTFKTDLNGNRTDYQKIIVTHDLNIGLGFITNFTKKFFLKTGFGAGFYTSASHDYWGYSANARMSLGYRF